MSGILPCCQSYSNLIPVSIRTHTGDWVLVWKCEVCNAHYHVEFNTNAGNTVIVTGLKEVDKELLDSNSIVLTHERVDRFQLRNILAGIDLFYHEKEEALDSNIDSRIELNCPNCLVNPTITEEGGDELTSIIATCQSCHAEYLMESLKNDPDSVIGYDYRILRMLPKAEQDPEPGLDEMEIVDHDGDTIEEYVDDEEEISDTSNEDTDETMDDGDTTSVEEYYEQLEEEEVPTLTDLDSENIVESHEKYTPDLEQNSTIEEHITDDEVGAIHFKITYTDNDTVRSGKYSEHLRDISIHTTKEFTIKGGMTRVQLETDVRLNLEQTEDGHGWSLDMRDPQPKISSDAILDVVVTEEIERGLLDNGQYLLSVYVISVYDHDSSFLGYVLIHVSPHIEFSITNTHW